MQRFSPLRSVAVAIATATAAAAQAAFFPIPNVPGAAAANENGCYVSEQPRLSADGSTVAFKVFPAVAVTGAVPSDFAIWTEAGGTQVIAPNVGYGSNFGWGISGISADGNIVYGDDWVWRRVGGYQSLASTLQPLGFASIFGCSFDGAVVAGFRPDNPGIPFPGDLFRWQIAQPTQQFLPRAAGYPDGYLLFNCISGDGSIVGGSAYAAGQTDSYAGALLTSTGSVLITPPSAGNVTMVRDLSFDGSVAVGQASLPGPFGGFGLDSFRWTAATGLQVLPVFGSASSANACDALGNVVVGSYLNFGIGGTRAYIWTAVDGVLDLQDELVSNQGLGVALQGWTLLDATDVSADGSTIVGQGINPDGCLQSFLVRLVPGGGSFAQLAKYGRGCYRRAASVYEYWQTPTTYDLANTTISFLANGSGYTVQSGSVPYVTPPASATNLVFSSTSEATVNLPGPFTYPGGITSSLVVCSNGFVSAASGNGGAFVPNAGLHLNGPAASWRHWSWYDPSAPGSGKVKYHVANGVCFVTWDGVFSYGLPFPAFRNTFQFQFELATGNVHLVIGSISTGGIGRLVGYSPGGPSVDPGNTDLSLALATPFQLPASDQKELALSASARPVVGSTIQLVTSEVTGTSLGANCLSLGQLAVPGIDLAPLGAPGCRVLVDIAGSVLTPIGNLPGSSLSLPLPLPNTSTILGLAIYSQSLWLDATQNAFGATTSNGLILQLGNF